MVAFQMRRFAASMKKTRKGTNAATTRMEYSDPAPRKSHSRTGGGSVVRCAVRVFSAAGVIASIPFSRVVSWRSNAVVTWRSTLLYFGQASRN